MRHITYYFILLAIITVLLVVIKISIDFPFKVFLFELNLWHGNNNEAYFQYCQQDLGILNNNLSTQNEGANLTRYVTSNFNRPGGIGNQIWRIASLYGIGQVTNREAYFDGRNLEQMTNMTELIRVFPRIKEKIHIKCPNNDKVKALPHFARDCCKYDNPERLNNFQEQYLKTSGDYLQSYKYFHPYRNEIKEILKCSDKVMKNVTKTAKSLFKKDNSHLLCTHIRRTDFLEDLMLESKVEFVQPAIEFALKFLMNKSHEHISLMLFGDDHKFIKENITLSHLSFDHVYLLNSTTRGEDFCLAVNYCDSMIMTASGSTFSWWISYLMPKNSTIFYNTQVSDTADFSKDTFDYDYFLPEWIRLTASNGTVYVEDKWWHQRTRKIENKTESESKKIFAIGFLILFFVVLYYLIH